MDTENYSPMSVVFIEQVCPTIGLGKSTLYKMIADGKFPKPRQIGGRRMGWLRSEVDDYLKNWASMSDGMVSK